MDTPIEEQEGSVPAARTSHARAVTLSLLVSAAALSSYGAWADAAPGMLTVAFLDVGQGDAVYIQSPTGNDMLIDGGPPTGAALAALAAVMRASDRRLDVVLATHPDSDHIGGLSAVLARYEVGSVVTTGNRSDSGAFASFSEAAVVEPGASHIDARRGDVIDLGGGAVFTVLFPDRDASDFESNASSIAGILAYGSTSIWLSGDSPSGVERYLVSGSGVPGGADVLKLGHHGSDTSNSDELLGAAQPAYVVVSAGRGNAYGHPTPDVIARARAIGACVVRTDESGTVVFHSDGHSLRTDAPCSDEPGPLPRE